MGATRYENQVTPTLILPPQGGGNIKKFVYPLAPGGCQGEGEPIFKSIFPYQKRYDRLNILDLFKMPHHINQLLCLLRTDDGDD
jgi:hypothetical protein